MHTTFEQAEALVAVRAELITQAAFLGLVARSALVVTSGGVVWDASLITISPEQYMTVATQNETGVCVSYEPGMPREELAITLRTLAAYLEQSPDPSPEINPLGEPITEEATEEA